MQLFSDNFQDIVLVYRFGYVAERICDTVCHARMPLGYSSPGLCNLDIAYFWSD